MDGLYSVRNKHFLMFFNLDIVSDLDFRNSDLDITILHQRWIIC